MKKNKYFIPLFAVALLLAACNDKEETKVEEKQVKEPTEVVETNKESTEKSTEVTDSTGNETLDFLNENSSDYDELLAEAIRSNEFSKELIEKKAKETVSFIENLYGKDAQFTTEEGISKYLKEQTKLSSSSIESQAAYFITMNVPGETSEFTYSIDKAQQISVDAIEIQFKADVTFYKKETNEKIDSITRYHTVIIGQDQNDKEKFIIYKLDINE